MQFIPLYPGDSTVAKAAITFTIGLLLVLLPDVHQFPFTKSGSPNLVNIIVFNSKICYSNRHVEAYTHNSYVHKHMVNLCFTISKENR